MPVKRVLRQKLSVTLIARPDARERLRIFTSLAFQRISFEFQELHSGCNFPVTRFRRADHREPARISPLTAPYAIFFELKAFLYAPAKSRKSFMLPRRVEGPGTRQT